MLVEVIRLEPSDGTNHSHLDEIEGFPFFSKRLKNVFLKLQALAAIFLALFSALLCKQNQRLM